MLYDIIIIGGGPAGLTAALYAARAGWKTLLLEKMAITGGQAATTPVIENWPGSERISGIELAERMEAQAKNFGAEIRLMTAVNTLSLFGKVKKVKTTDGDFEARAVIIATGRREKKLDIPGESAFKGRGVSYCALCDGAFFKEKTIAVIGGGNAALDEGNFLTTFASKVIIIHRRGEFRADKISVERAKANKKIEFIMDSTVTEIIGDKKVTAIKIKNVKSGEEATRAVDGIFIYIGMVPNSDIFTEIKKDDYGYILTNEKMETDTEGVFAAGDVRKADVYQITTAVADGTIAAVMAGKYLEREKG